MAERIIDWADLEQGDGLLHCAQIALDLADEATSFDFNNAEASRRAQERFIVLLNSVQGYVREAREILDTAVDIGRANALLSAAPARKIHEPASPVAGSAASCCAPG